MNVPLVAIKKIVESMNTNFKNHLNKIFVYNPSVCFNAVFGLLTKMYSTAKLNKISVIKKGNEGDLLDHINPNLWQMKYGGNLEDIGQGDFWPPKQIDKKPLCKEEILEKDLEVFDIIGDSGDRILFCKEKPFQRVNFMPVLACERSSILSYSRSCIHDDESSVISKSMVFFYK